jgi:hypothetical protein
MSRSLSVHPGVIIVDSSRFRKMVGVFSLLSWHMLEASVGNQIANYSLVKLLKLLHSKT